MTAAITVEGLGKRYKIARVNSRGGYRTLRETLSEGVVSLVGRLRGRAGAPALADFWALRDVG
ncbi:MAG TPA: hypothetical protein VFF52_28705, partial [Isosphaeraceae bacterium]|nr:hypothetical protein [Isosphaeraceae bacterium]